MGYPCSALSTALSCQLGASHISFSAFQIFGVSYNHLCCYYCHDDNYYILILKLSFVLVAFAFVTRWPYCPGRPKKLCFTRQSLAVKTVGARLSEVKQSFFGLPGQYGRCVTKANPCSPKLVPRPPETGESKCFMRE